MNWQNQQSFASKWGKYGKNGLFQIEICFIIHTYSEQMLYICVGMTCLSNESSIVLSNCDFLAFAG